MVAKSNSASLTLRPADGFAELADQHAAALTISAEGSYAAALTRRVSPVPEEPCPFL